MRFEDYPITLNPIPDNEGGGYMVTVPDLPGCVADGETVEEAIAEARDAFKAWTVAEQEDAGALPAPKTYSGQFVQRIPKTLHMRLSKRAKSEGISLNQLAATFLAESRAGRDKPHTSSFEDGTATTGRVDFDALDRVMQGKELPTDIHRLAQMVGRVFVELHVQVREIKSDVRAIDGRLDRLEGDVTELKTVRDDDVERQIEARVKATLDDMAAEQEQEIGRP